MGDVPRAAHFKKNRSHPFFAAHGHPPTTIDGSSQHKEIESKDNLFSRVGKAAQEIASVAFRLVTGRDGQNGTVSLKEAAFSNSSSLHHSNGGQAQQQQHICIHSVSSLSRNVG